MPRTLHPVAWWIWALGLATAASRTTNPLLLLLVLAVLGVVVAHRRSDAPWARAFKYYLYLALTVVVIRVAFRSVFGGDVDTGHAHVLFDLPHLPLPRWMSGVQLGGPVTLEGTLSALYDGLRLGCLLCCLGAANALANPKRALRVAARGPLRARGRRRRLAQRGSAVGGERATGTPGPQAPGRVRTSGLRALRSIAVPVMEDALERSLRLAAAMDSRGYGRTGGASRRARRATGALLVAGMGGLCVGAYGLLDGSTAGPLGFPALAGGSVLCCLGLALGSRRVGCSQYRPDPWKAPEWAVAASGIVPAVVLVVGAGFSTAGLNPSVSPLAWPSLPLVPALAIAVAAVAAVAAPPPVRTAPAVDHRPAPAGEQPVVVDAGGLPRRIDVPA